jgi:hypothetical protein
MPVVYANDREASAAALALAVAQPMKPSDNDNAVIGAAGLSRP